MSCIRSCFAAAGACDTAARAPFPCRYGQILDAAERALNAFTAADSARDDADARVHAVSEQARTIGSRRRGIRGQRLLRGGGRHCRHRRGPRARRAIMKT